MSAAAVTVSAEWLANIRLRAERGDCLCLHEHTIHNDGYLVRITCDSPVEPKLLGSLTLARSAADQSDDIRMMCQRAMRDHEAAAAGFVVLTLLSCIHQQEDES